MTDMTDVTGESANDRSEVLAARLHALDRRVATACADAGRAREDVRVVVVTKTWPAGDVRRLAALGVTDVGENRDQEASGKAAQCADLELSWHFVGSIQTNKARSIASYIDVVHSVDRIEVAHALAAGAQRAGRTLDVFVQVSLDAAPGRGGVAPGGVRPLADAVAAAAGLRLRGVMGVAPLPTGTPYVVGASAARAFADLRHTADQVRAEHPSATWISAGMSNDLEQAVAAGATHLRVGTAVLGSRPPLR